MPNPARTWVSVINTAFSNQLDQQVQYREIFFAIHDLFRDAGWVVERSSNGTTAGAGDNINSSSDVDIDLSGAGSWAVYRSPAGFLPSSGQIWVLFYTNNANADTTPQTAQMQVATATYTGGTTAALPTTIGVQTTVLTSGDDIIPWAAVVSGRYMTQRSTRGDVRFGVKIEGIGEWRHFSKLVSQTDDSGMGSGNLRFGLFALSSTSVNVLTASALSTSANWRGFDSGGNNSDNPEAQSPLANVATWTSGIDFQGEPVTAPIDMFSDAATRGRYMGTLVDIDATVVTLAFGQLDDTESAQTQRRVCMGDGIFLNGIPSASLPFA